MKRQTVKGPSGLTGFKVQVVIRPLILEYVPCTCLIHFFMHLPLRLYGKTKIKEKNTDKNKAATTTTTSNFVAFSKLSRLGY